jgi:transposase
MLLESTTPGSGGCRPHYVEAAHAKSSWAKVRAISVDETGARRGHRYVTNVLNTETHELLLMVEGRSAAALEAFAQALVAHGEGANRSLLSAWT